MRSRTRQIRAGRSCPTFISRSSTSVSDELLDAYLFIENADALYAEYVARGVEFTRALGDTAWHSREFVVKDCDSRLLAFGADQG